MSVGKFLRVRSGLRIGQRVAPPVAEWVEREARRLRRERRESALDHAFLFVALSVGIAAVVWFGMELLVGGGL